MKLIKNDIVVKCLNLFFISILLFNITNSVVNVHSHQLENGEVVTHAHPFDHQGDDAPFKSHHHSSFEFIILDTLNNFIINSFLFLALVSFALNKNKNYSIKLLQKQSYLCFKQNKSPPVKIAF